MGLYELTTTIKKNIVVDSINPIIHANFFGCAFTYSGVWLPTIKRPIISVGENLGLTTTRMIKSARNIVITYLIGKKLFWNITSMREIKIARNNKPADARISLSFKTGMLYPSTFSPNCISLLIYLFLLV